MRPVARLAPLALLLSAAPAQAALPPSHQRAAELRAVLNAPGLVDALGNGLIERVEYIAADLYRVRAGRCHVDARIVGLPRPRPMPGARRFEVRLERRVCG